MAVGKCSACGAMFQGLNAFDTHRLGKYERGEWQGKGKHKQWVIIQRNTRHCMTVAEMRAHDLTQNDKGRWHQQIDDVAKERLKSAWRSPVSTAQLTMPL